MFLIMLRLLLIFLHLRNELVVNLEKVIVLFLQTLNALFHAVYLSMDFIIELWLLFYMVFILRVGILNYFIFGIKYAL